MRKLFLLKYLINLLLDIAKISMERLICLVSDKTLLLVTQDSICLF